MFFYLFVNLRIFKINKQIPFYYFSNIIFLSCFLITFISNIFLSRMFNSCKSVEFGVLNNFINKSSSSVLSYTRITSFKLFSLNSLFIVFVFSFFMFFILTILLYNINYYVQLLLVISSNQSAT